MTPPSKIVCLCVGDKYPFVYVERLYGGLVRHTNREFEFDCVRRGEFLGWWNKLMLFNPPLRIVYLDLDVVITGNVDFLFDYEGPFCIWKDPWADKFNSSVMSIGPGFGANIKEVFLADPQKAMREFYGDQEFITASLETMPDLWPAEKVKSYKADHLEDGPNGASVCVFHGQPKPADFKEGWVHDAWV